MTYSATFKVKVVIGEPSPPPPPPPPPPFVGSRLRLGIAEDGHTFKIMRIALADGSESATVDWGDGNVEQITGTAAHTYATAGEYEVKISDDISLIAFNDSENHDDSPLAFVSNAERLATIQQFCFSGCSRLASVDIRESELSYLSRACFENCTALTGELYFPKVNRLAGVVPKLPFTGCTGGITKIHFAAANEESIRASAQYQADPTLGSGTAEVVFDL